MKGNLVPEKNAKKLLKSGYIDSRTLYGYRIQKKPSSKSKPSSTSSYNTYTKSSSNANYKNSYNSSSRSDSNVDLIANMKQMFAAAKSNVPVQPDIDEIENDAQVEFVKPRKRREKSSAKESKRYDYSNYATSRSHSNNPSKYSEQNVGYMFTKEQEKLFRKQQKEAWVLNNTIEEIQRNLLRNKAPKELPTYKGYASSYVKSQPKVKTTFMSQYGSSGGNGFNALLKAEMNLKAQRNAQEDTEKQPPKSRYNPRAHYNFI